MDMLNPIINPFVLILAGVGAAAALAALVFRSSTISERPLRLLLFGLRMAVLLILIFVLLNPRVEREVVDPEARDHNILLVDVSESMSLETPESRLDGAESIAQPILDNLDYKEALDLFVFSDRLYSRFGFAPGDVDSDAGSSEDVGAPTVGSMRPVAEDNPAAHQSSNLANALERLLTRYSDLGIGNVFVLSDGRAHDAERLGEVARRALAEDVRVHTLALGSDVELPNVAIEHFQVRRQAPPGSRIPVNVRVRGEGVAGEQLTLRLTDGDGVELAETTFFADETTSEHALELEVTARDTPLTLSLDPIDNEITLVDNSFDFRVEAVDPKIRVLYMEGSNHRDLVWDTWEWEFIERALTESDIEVDSYTVDRQMSYGGRLFNVDDDSASIPATREGIFKYDIVICSDINRFIFTQEQLEAVRDLVSERGGGFVMIGGNTSFGIGGWDKTVWERMIPVDMDTFATGHLGDPTPIKIPDEAREHPIWRIDPDDEKNNTILDQHPRFHGSNIVNRAKPGATVLAYHPERRIYTTQSRVNSQGIRMTFTETQGFMPLICVQDYGKGRAMAFTSDAAGGWGKTYQTEWGVDGPYNQKTGNIYYQQFWVNTVRWLAEKSLRRLHTNVIGDTESVTYKPGQTIRVRAELPAVDERERADYAVAARLDLADGGRTTRMEFDSERRLFTGELKLPEDYTDSTASIVFEARDPEGEKYGDDSIDVRVLKLSREYDNPRPDPLLLSQLSEVTGGQVFNTREQIEAELDRLMKEKQQRAQIYSVPLWDSAWLWGLMILLLSADWLIRKLVSMT